MTSLLSVTSPSASLSVLHNALIVGAILFTLGLVGILTRRNLIVMFLSAELMLQGISVSLVAWSRYHGDYGGHVLV
ncbi:MAG: NADH-quinone oxidoreductase subunit NuoK, partial [Planctomycetota bacterium]